MPKGAAIVLEGGFDRHDIFFFLGDTATLTEIWRRRVVQWPAPGAIALLLDMRLLNPDFARKILPVRISSHIPRGSLTKSGH